MSVPAKSSIVPRRLFMVQALSAGGAMFLACEASAQAMVAESDPQAQALGYKADAAKVDKTKNPKFVAGQHCASCALYQGKPGATAGPCGIFPGKQVAAGGWCSAYTKKT